MILLTGSTGHLGSHILYELAKINEPVRALYRDKSHIDVVRKIFGFYQADHTKLFKNIEWIQADINDYFALMDAMQGITKVIHAAGIVTFRDKDRKKLNHVNINGTKNIVNACLETGIEKLCHVSSIATLGELGIEKPLDESVIWNRGLSASNYAISKFTGEMHVWRGIYEGLNAVIVNPSVIIGPGMWIGPGKDIFFSVLSGIKFYPTGSTGFVDVRDVARILILLSESSINGERFILNSENISHQKFISFLAREMGRPAPKLRLSPGLAYTALWLEGIRAFISGTSPRINRRSISIMNEKLSYSNSKIYNALGFNFTSVEDSIKSAVQIYFETSRIKA